MRMYPPAPMMSRFCEETTKLSEDLTVEKGTTVVWGTNRKFWVLIGRNCPDSDWLILEFNKDPDYYENPEKFDPDRFKGNESNTLQDENWFGFGQGPRSCPG